MKKKLVCVAAVLLATIVTSALPSFTASAGNYSVHNVNVKIYGDTVYEPNSMFSVVAGQTSLKALNSAYYYSYKRVDYTQYGQSGASYYEINSADNYGCADPIYNSYLTVTDEVALRHHGGQLHLTSNPGSSIVESYGYNVYKG